MKILILNILLLFSIPYLYAQPFNCSLTPSNTDRNVFWLHGYQGSAENFISASEDVECTFEAASNRIAYNTSQQSLAVSANTVEAAIRNISSSQSNHNKERNFIIAHSMGGLVAREMGALTDNNGNELFDGLITFGTPHQGAAIADTYVNDKQSILDFLQDACKALAKGPLEEGVNNNGILGKVVVGLGFVGSYTNLGCDAGVDIGFPLIIDFLEVGVEQELTTTNASNIPAMATSNNAVFYGIEDGHNDGTLSARMAGAILNDANNDYPLYGADASDAEGIATIQTGLDRYIDGANHPNNRIANSYQVGADWFDEIDPFWQEVTGVSEIQFVKTGCECIVYDYGDPVSTYTTGDENSDCYQESMYDPDLDCYDYYEPMIVTANLSDGFILESSASNGPGMNYPAQLMDGSNHLQMRNDSEMQDAVEAIFENGLQGTFFITPFR